MSSHHIVKEKQEPALLIINLAGFDEEHLGQLLEWSPTVVVSDMIIDEVLSLGIKVDAVLTSEDNSWAFAQEHILQINYTENALNGGLNYFVNEGYPAVNVIDDKFSFSNYSSFVSQIDLVIFNSEQKIYPIYSGFSKWQKANEEIEILYPQDVNDLSFTGLDLTKENLFKTQKDGFYSFTFSKPYIFIAEFI
jgi:thiamine pyrophosphokinase